MRYENVPVRCSRVQSRCSSRFSCQHLLRPNSHEPSDKVDAAMEASTEGIRTVWMSLAILAVTAVLQAVVVAISGPVALLGDRLHNAADALTTVPLAIEFFWAGARRPAAVPTDTAGPTIWPEW